MKIVISMTLVGVLLGVLIVIALARPGLLADLVTPAGATEAAAASEPVPEREDESPRTQAEWDAVYSQWLDEAAGHPDDPMLPASVIGASDEVLLATDPTEVAEMLRSTRTFVEERASSPRHRFALGRAAWTHGYDRIGLELLERAADAGSGAALAYLGYDAAERGESTVARSLFELALAKGFRSRDVMDAIAAIDGEYDTAEEMSPAAAPEDDSLDPFALPPLPRFDADRFNRSDLVRALFEGDMETLRAEPTWNTIYVSALHETLADQSTLFFVEDKSFALEIDPTLSARASAKLASDPTSVEEMVGIGLGAFVGGLTAMAKTRQAGGTVTQEVAAMNEALLEKTMRLELLRRHAENDGRRLAIMYDASPDEFRRVYRGIRQFLVE